MRKHGLTLIDLIIVAAAIAILLTVTLVTAHLADETENRVQCARNLKQIGQAMLLYANENRGAFPRATYVAAEASKSKPVWGTPYEGPDAPGPLATAGTFAKPTDPGAKTRPHANDITAALYLLIRTQDITSDVFVCPSTRQTKWDFGGGSTTAISWTNWTGNAGIRQHLSYSFQNPYASETAASAGYRFNFELGAEFALVADMNPGTDALLKLTLNSRWLEMRDGNSLNHAREGQNILYGDGHVQFESMPFAGQKLDNIYTYGPSGRNQPRGGDGIVGSPAGPNDSILLPTSKDIGLIDGAGNPLPTTQPAGQ